MTPPLVQKDLEGNVAKSTKPFLKWAGGKSNLLPKLRKLVPEGYNKYMEPFLGGGALFFDLCPSHAIISDLNSELINCYIAVRDHSEEILEKLKEIPVNSKTYYEIRDLNPREIGKIERAVRLIYLNKTCYNGLYRVNKKGEFNTPYGKNDNVRVYTPKIIRRASRALKNAIILQGDFEPTLIKYATPEDFIYLDPPYPPVGEYSDFTRYTRDFFYEKDHFRLAEVVQRLDKSGCKFVLSSAKHPMTLKLYAGFRKIEVKAPRYINCKGDNRGYVSELLITNQET